MMKQFFRSIVLATALLTGSMALTAQEVNTLYFLENAPMRTLFNPALMPVSSGYIVFSPLGYTSLLAGNNALTISDLIYTKNGQTITALNQGETQKLVNKLWHPSGLVTGDVTTTILGFGARTQKGGYFHGGILLRGDVGLSIPKGLATSMFTNQGVGLDLTKPLALSGLNLSMQWYWEVSGGYTRPLNDKWTIGGKLKFLVGVGNVAMDFNSLTITPGQEGQDAQLDLAGKLRIAMPGGLDPSLLLPAEGEGLIENFGQRFNNMIAPVQNGKYLSLLVPGGYGAAIDFGFTYKPIKYVQIAAAVNDLGFIYWTNGIRGDVRGNMPFDGIGTVDIKANDQGQIDTQAISDQINEHLQGYVNAIQASSQAGGYARMTRARLNVSVDGLFWDDRVGVGLLSQTKLYNNHIYEELTIGGFFRPVKWFNLAASYSILNGHGGNVGAALGFAPYDGIMLTLATDYVPCYYADASPITKSNKPQYFLPYKTPALNVALGFSIVWGTNKKYDADKDGVLDKLDMCPRTPRNIRVDAMGCPVDTDGDGVPDYLDECPRTPKAAYGMTDSVGCELDSDLDGVPDYRDLCPNTPAEARSSVNEHGCTRDTDGDGVPDYRDDCPNTLPEAVAFVDEHGCDKDTDGDGVPDYRDKCPDTPEEAYTYLDENGCPLDLDEDGVPDYKDKCPRTVFAARQYVDSCGCDKDTDLDGVPDYQDECPLVPGVRENKGCPQVKRSVTNILKKAMSGIQFETGKAVILKKSYPILNQVADVFKENPDYIIEVQGHTDNVGNPDANMTLSQKRAQAVRDYLIKAGIEGSRMTAHGYGDTMPIDDNKTKAGRAKNRRVEFKITFEEVHEVIVNDHNPGTDVQQPAPTPDTTEQ